jgi:hypothetical protein
MELCKRRILPAEEPDVQAVLKWHELSFPIEKGQTIGEIKILNAKGKLIQKVPLFAENFVSETWWHWLNSFF